MFNLKKEVKEIEGYPLRYIDTSGQVWSKVKRGKSGGQGELRLLKGCKDHCGYLQTSFLHDKKVKIHQLVAKAFIPNPNNYPFVCHKDNDPANNRVENLYWGTQKMNLEQASKENRIHRSFGRITRPKLNPQKVKLIRMMFKDFKWKRSKIYRILGKTYGVHKSCINKIINNETWKYV